jgi:hypothetical protein
MGHASQQLVFHSTCVQTHDFSRGGPALGSPRRGQNHAFARRYSDSALSHQLSVTKLLSNFSDEIAKRLYCKANSERQKERKKGRERERERAIRLVTVSSTGLEPAVNCLLNSLGKLDYAVCQ